MKSPPARESPLQQSRYRALLDAAVDAIIEIDRRGRIRRYNRSAEHMFGYSATETLGRNVRMLMPAPHAERHDHYIARYLATGEARIIGIGRSTEGRHKSGRVFPIDLSVGEVHHGDEVSFVGIIRDQSERQQAVARLRELEDQLTHAARLATLGEMAAGIAHEINQPLTAISNYAHACQRLLAQGPERADEVTAALDKIARQAERAGAVVAGLRRSVSDEPGESGPVDVNAAIGELAALLEEDARRFGLALDFELDPERPLARGSRVQLQQIVLNLVRNAVDAMAEARHDDRILVTTRRQGEAMLEIRVDDAGPGVPEDLGEAIFDAFVTRKPGGLGLGLSICRTLARRQGGELRQVRRPGGGSSFCLTLPEAT